MNSRTMLQSGLEKSLQWYVDLANQIVAYQSQEAYKQAVLASSLDPEDRKEQRVRREAPQKAQSSMRLGARLVKQRNSKKRTFEEMNEVEQQALEDYETGRTKKAKLYHGSKNLASFRCSRSAWN